MGTVPISTAKAANETWIKLGDGNYMLNGTDIQVQISGDTIHVSRNGAIPDYTERTLSQRLWHKSDCKKLVIDNTITSIGVYAFASFNQLEHVTLCSSSVIAGRTFKILSTEQGSVEVLDDLDTNDATVTFSIKIPQTIFAVVYQ